MRTAFFPTTFAGGAEELAGTAVPIVSTIFNGDTVIAKMRSWALSGTVAYNLSLLRTQTRSYKYSHVTYAVIMVFIAAAAGVYESATKEDKKKAKVLSRKQNIIDNALGLKDKQGENLCKAVLKYFTGWDFMKTAEGSFWFLNNLCAHFPKAILEKIKGIFSGEHNFEKGEDVQVLDDDSTLGLNKCDFDAGLGDVSQQLGNGLSDVNTTIVKEARRASTYELLNQVDSLIYLARDLGDRERLIKYLDCNLKFAVELERRWGSWSDGEILDMNNLDLYGQQLLRFKNSFSEGEQPDDVRRNLFGDVATATAVTIAQTSIQANADSAAIQKAAQAVAAHDPIAFDKSTWIPGPSGQPQPPPPPTPAPLTAISVPEAAAAAAAAPAAPAPPPPPNPPPRPSFTLNVALLSARKSALKAPAAQATQQPLLKTPQPKQRILMAPTPTTGTTALTYRGQGGGLQPPPPPTPAPQASAPLTEILLPAAAPPTPNPPPRPSFTLNATLLSARKSALKAPAAQATQQPLLQTPQPNQSLLVDRFSVLMSARRQTVAPSSNVSSTTSETWSI